MKKALAINGKCLHLGVGALAFETNYVQPLPVVVVIPTIAGDPNPGDILAVTDEGTWTNTPTSYSYQWYADDVLIVGETASTYTILEADIGSVLSCYVTATNAGGDSNPAESNGITAEAGGILPTQTMIVKRYAWIHGTGQGADCPDQPAMYGTYSYSVGVYDEIVSYADFQLMTLNQCFDVVDYPWSYYTGKEYDTLLLGPFPSGFLHETMQHLWTSVITFRALRGGIKYTVSGFTLAGGCSPINGTYYRTATWYSWLMMDTTTYTPYWELYVQSGAMPPYFILVFFQAPWTEGDYFPPLNGWVYDRYFANGVCSVSVPGTLTMEFGADAVSPSENQRVHGFLYTDGVVDANPDAHTYACYTREDATLREGVHACDGSFGWTAEDYPDGVYYGVKTVPMTGMGATCYQWGNFNRAFITFQGATTVEPKMTPLLAELTMTGSNIAAFYPAYYDDYWVTGGWSWLAAYPNSYTRIELFATLYYDAGDWKVRWRLLLIYEPEVGVRYTELWENYNTEGIDFLYPVLENGWVFVESDIPAEAEWSATGITMLYGAG